ncbi:hypothetical protein M3924_003380 [Vibrio fluvialis]|nr:hypothetical protein [Vibrio fluvialis]
MSFLRLMSDLIKFGDSYERVSKIQREIDLTNAEHHLDYLGGPDELKKKLTEAFAISELLSLLDDNPKLFFQATNISEEDIKQLKTDVYKHQILGQIITQLKAGSSLKSSWHDIEVEKITTSQGITHLSFKRHI